MPGEVAASKPVREIMLGVALPAKRTRPFMTSRNSCLSSVPEPSASITANSACTQYMHGAHAQHSSLRKRSEARAGCSAARLRIACIVLMHGAARREALRSEEQRCNGNPRLERSAMHEAGASHLHVLERH
jgi:hypothetical protein